MEYPQSIARRSAKKAFRLRKELGVSKDESINIYDTVTRLGLEVRFVDIPSLEGMYSQGEPPTVVISSLRPIVRQVFTCAHELGHHVFGHGEMIDELAEKRSSAKVVDQREQEADGFGANLLMTPTAVEAAFSKRGIVRDQLSPQEAYRVANYFQVGYATLIRHLQLSLRRISWSQAENLLRRPVREIRSGIIGQKCPNHLIVVDDNWNARVPLDCEVGDLVALPRSIDVDEQILSPLRESGAIYLFEAMAAGTATLILNPNMQITVRVARKQYTGRLQFRWEREVTIA